MQGDLYMNDDSQVQFNIRVHDIVSEKYEKIHGEIYNVVEQGRLQAKLKYAANEIKTESALKRVLDFGCGAGNLTNHLLGMGMNVVSSDVSGAFLELIERKFGNTSRSTTMLLNGTDLSDIPDSSFDMAATYSVLHHIPDYINAVKEMCRIVKPGGIVYIDHEHNENYWNKSKEYVDFVRSLASTRSWKRYLYPVNYYNAIKSKLLLLQNPRYQSEGDIHVFHDDHIQWHMMEKILLNEGFEIVLCEDYLLFKRDYDASIFESFKDKCSDMRLLIARKVMSQT